MDKRNELKRWGLAFGALLALNGSLLQEAGAAGEPVELLSGVVVDPTRERVYLMSPAGSVEALDVLTGNVIWTSEDIAKPLVSIGQVLVGQADSTDALRLGVVDADSGALVTTGAQTLPAGIEGQIEQTLAGRLTTAASVDGDEATVSWRFDAMPLQGAFDPTEAGEKPTGESLQQPMSGAVQFNVVTGETTSTELHGVAAVDAVPAGDTTPFERISVDGRHRLSSELVGDDRSLDKYRWTIRSVDSNQVVGRISAESAQEAFIVIGPVVLFESVASVRRVGEELVGAPRRLGATELASGHERWTRPLREVQFRGVVPP